MSGDRTPPNVALFASSFAPHLGGVEELSRRLARELRRRGSDTVVVTNRYPPDLPGTEMVEGIPVYRERFRFPERRPRHLAGWIVGTVPTRLGVGRAMDAHRCALVHVQCVSSNGYYAHRAARSAGLPLVVSLQGELTMDAGQAFQRSVVLRRSWRQLLAAADVVTGCSRQVVEEAVAEFGPGLADKARVVRNGTDVADVRAAVLERRERPYLLGIGRFVPQKGFDVLIDAFGQIAGEHPQHDLVLAGEGPEREALEARAQAGGLADRVVFLGGVPASRAFSLFRGAAGFVLASRHEPQGIVVVEAMAAGVPVVATSVGGVPETVRHGENGLLVQGDDADSMARGLRTLLDDPEAARARIAQAAVDVELYDWARITDEYQDCYEDAIRSWQDRRVAGGE
jgi:glycosyltransferase involved in cell wall biosynthesis